uniref:Ig-like domain-containing protein n=1 Tax=Eptatretus burgeri TaxID=7764 RepID=A0A8C4WWZ1_EPTBU
MCIGFVVHRHTKLPCFPIVSVKPQIHQFNDFNKVAAPGDGSSGVLMLCQAEGLPVVFFSWARNGIAVEPNEARYSFQTVHGVDKHETQLIITNVSAQLDFGTFTCTARNALGEDKLHIQLVKTSSPEPPTRLQLVTHTHNSVTLTWIAGYDGGFEQKFRVQ